MGSTFQDDAYRLHEKAEHWQNLATRQQELALQLRQLISDQRELVGLWDAAQADEVAGQARAIEDGLRNLSTSVVSLEKAALDLVAKTIAEEARLLQARRLRRE